MRRLAPQRQRAAGPQPPRTASESEWSSRSPYAVSDSLRQQLDCRPIRPRKAFARGFRPRQPVVRQVLTRIQDDQHRLGHLDREYMFGIVRRPLGVAKAPLRIDLVNIGEVPVTDAAIAVGVDPGLLVQLAPRGFGERLVRF